MYHFVQLRIAKVNLVTGTRSSSTFTSVFFQDLVMISSVVFLNNLCKISQECKRSKSNDHILTASQLICLCHLC